MGWQQHVSTIKWEPYWIATMVSKGYRKGKLLQFILCSHIVQTGDTNWIPVLLSLKSIGLFNRMRLIATSCTSSMEGTCQQVSVGCTVGHSHLHWSLYTFVPCSKHNVCLPSSSSAVLSGTLLGVLLKGKSLWWKGASYIARLLIQLCWFTSSQVLSCSSPPCP